MDNNNNVIKKRNIIVGALLTGITFGIYVLYWFVQTKREINKLGGQIPTSWLSIIPVVNLYWMFKYSTEFSRIIRKNTNGVLYFLLAIFFFPAFAIIVQMSLNKFEETGSSTVSETTVTPNSPSDTNTELSQNELSSKNYIEQYKAQYPRESIKTQLISSGIPENDVETYLNKYF